LILESFFLIKFIFNLFSLQLTFEGLWSRHTHPKDFPSNGWLTRFSDVIGASHTVDYRFWEYGKFASEGLRQVAEHGATRMLESELKEQVSLFMIKRVKGYYYPVRVHLFVNGLIDLKLIWQQ
jgi:hypothetical protein